MGKNLKKNYPFRTEEILIKKLDFIAKQDSRNRNQQMEFIIKKHIEQFESKNGAIQLEPQNGTINI